MAPIFKYGEVYYGADDATAAYLGTDIIFPLFKIKYAIDTEAVTTGNVDWTLRQLFGGTFNVDWGDGSSQTNQTSDALTHTYSSAGLVSLMATSVHLPDCWVVLGTGHQIWFLLAKLQLFLILRSQPSIVLGAAAHL